MPLEILYSLDSRDLPCIFRDLRRVPVAFFHLNAPDLPAEYFRKKGQHIPRLLIHRLGTVAQDRHIAREQKSQDHILQIGIILHFINDQMADVPARRPGQKPVFQIQQGIHILIFQKSLLLRYIPQRRISGILQQPVIDHIQIRGHIETLKSLPDHQQFFFRKCFIMERLIFIHKTLHYCIHSRQQRHSGEFIVEQLQDLLRLFLHALIFHVPEIHQTVLQFHKKSFHALYKFFGLLPAVSCFPVPNLTLDLMVSVLAVSNRILQFPIRKQVKTHFPDIFLPQLRKDMGNVVRKYAIRRQHQYIRGT